MKEKKAILGTLIFMIISIGVYWVLKKIGVEGNVSYATILLLPILVYVILADKITSFKAGNIEATFKEVANQKISTGDDSIEQLSNDDNLEIIAKGPTSILSERVINLKKKTDGNKIILTLKMGIGGYYTREAVARYIKDLFMFTKFRFIVLLDSNQKVVAFISKEKLSAILENKNLGREFIRIVNDGVTQELNIFPGIILNKIMDSTRNIEALKEMDSNGLDELIVVDKKGRLKGVIQREDILSKLMIALAN
ncbi:CBS domain-containing protein [Aquimarina aquimarini]|uniref:CBS domain-containing protein n=1 Tax=Aquimarina aquimarini TaxID=1191734 RepID=UPI000D556551|nr:CBS domain-containing protein [Aquimarina aquimarini]